MFWKYYTKLGGFLFIIPLFIFFYLTNFQKEIIIKVLLFFILQLIVGSFLKYFFFKERPKKESYNNFFTKIKASAFPSIHSANTFLLFLFSLYYLSFFYSIVFVIFWLSISYSRIVLKKHFYIDILSGIILSGIVFGIFLFFSGNIYLNN